MNLRSIETIYPTTRLKWFEMALLNSMSQTVCFPSRRLVEPTRSLGTASCLLWTLEQDAPALHWFILIRTLFCRPLFLYALMFGDTVLRVMAFPSFKQKGIWMSHNTTKSTKDNNQYETNRLNQKVSEVAWFIVFKFHAKNRPKRLITYNANLTFANNHKSQIHPAPIVWQNA